MLIGEVWESAGHWLAGDMFDSTMNYDLRKHCRRFFAERTIDAAAFDGRVTHMRMRYKLPMTYAQLNLLDSHDVSRFFSLCGEDEARMRLAVLFQMTFLGAPSIFYGDERGIAGVLEDEYRHPMDWSDTACPLADFYRQAIRLRREQPALRRGSYTTLCAEGGLYGYRRTDNQSAVSVWLNNQDTEVLLPATPGQTLWAQGLENGRLAPMGFAVFREEHTP